MTSHHNTVSVSKLLWFHRYLSVSYYPLSACSLYLIKVLHDVLGQPVSDNELKIDMYTVRHANKRKSLFHKLTNKVLSISRKFQFITKIFNIFSGRSKKHNAFHVLHWLWTSHIYSFKEKYFFLQNFWLCKSHADNTDLKKEI